MIWKVKRLNAFNRIRLGLAMLVLSIGQWLSQIDLLYGLLLRDRRIARRAHWVSEQRRFSWGFFGFVPWGIAVTIYLIISFSFDPRPGLILAAEYGGLLAFYVTLRSLGIIKTIKV